MPETSTKPSIRFDLIRRPLNVLENSGFDLNAAPSRLFRFPLHTGELPVNWVWVLSGGGAKGSFQVGASLFLSRHGRFNPKGVVGTSVGAINALALAESSQAGFDLLKKSWLSLKNIEDMYAFSESLNRIDELQIFRDAQLSFRAILSTSSELDFQAVFGRLGGLSGSLLNAQISFWVIVNQMLGGLPGTVVYFLGHVSGIGPAADIEEKIKTLKRDISFAFDTLFETKGVWTFRPLETRLRNSVRYANVKIPLLLVSVALQDRKVYAVNERGELLVQTKDANGNFVMERRGTLAAREAEALIQGALASASIPVINPPFDFKYDTPQGRLSLSFFDGGVREIIPVNAALSMVNQSLRDKPGKKGLLVISAGAVTPRAEDAIYTELKLATASSSDINLFDSGAWALDVLTDEIAAGELHDIRYSLPSEVEVLEITPSVALGGTSDLDPGLVQINLGYGYMTAFDRVKQRTDNLSADYYRQRLWNTTNRISQARYMSWKLEREGAALIWEYPMLAGLRPDIPKTWIFKRGTVPRIRNLKNGIAQSVDSRIRDHGLGSIPGLYDLSYFGSRNENVYADWWRHWERHALRPEISNYRKREPDGSGLIDPSRIDPRNLDQSLVDFGRFGSPWEAQWEYEIIQPEDIGKPKDFLRGYVIPGNTLNRDEILNTTHDGREIRVRDISPAHELIFFEKHGFYPCFVKIYPVPAATKPFLSLAERAPDYALVRLEGYVFDPARPAPQGTVPLIAYWSPADTNHITTIRTLPSPQYQRLGVVGYIYPDRSKAAGLLPLYTWWSETRRDHMTTTDCRFIDGNPYGTHTPVALIDPDYRAPRLEGYLFDYDKEPPQGTVPVFSWISFERKDYAIRPDWRAPYKS